MTARNLTRLHRVPADDDVLAFAAEMQRVYNVPIVDKRSAPEMRFVASALEALGVLDSYAFLQSYSTYLFGRVYLPWKPGTTGDPSREIITIAHEYGHAYQDRRAGPMLEFEIDYLDTGKRAVLEAECYALGPCLSIRYQGIAAGGMAVQGQIDRAVLSFRTGYGRIPAADIEKFRTELTWRVERYERNWQPWNAHLRTVTGWLDRRIART